MEEEFDILVFLDRIPVLLRIVYIVCCVTVFSCIMGGALLNGQCMIGGRLSTCNYGLSVGWMGLIIGVLSIGIAATWQRLGSRTRRTIYLMEAISDVVFTIMWLAAFILLAAEWHRTMYDATWMWVVDNCRATIAFAFFAFFFQASIVCTKLKAIHGGILREELDEEERPIIDTGEAGVSSLLRFIVTARTTRQSSSEVYGDSNGRDKYEQI